MATINNLLAKSKLVSNTLRDLADRVEASDKSNEGDNVTIISIYEWLVKNRFCKPVYNHESSRPPIEFMIDIVDGCPLPNKVPFEYVNWAMDYTNNCMFVSVNSIVCREHFNILKEACEKYLNDKTR